MGKRGRATIVTRTKTSFPDANALFRRLSLTSLKASASACGLPKNRKVGAISDQRGVQRRRVNVRQEDSGLSWGGKEAEHLTAWIAVGRK